MFAFLKTNKIQKNIETFASCRALAKTLMPAFSSEYAVFPGFCDVHVHFREPGFSYKETVDTGCLSAARGGYTAVCTMPNLNPVPDSVENISQQKKIIARDATIDVFPYASITVGQKGEELSDFDGMRDLCIAFSDDGRGVQSESLMREAMEKAKSLDKIIVAHCEDNALLFGGYIHDGEYAHLHNHKGICSESEWGPIKRDIALIRETGVKYHVCHISTAESVELIRQAKRDGLDITCETAPHYLIMNDMDLCEDGRFKMNPPIRSERDRAALVEGLLDGTIDMIATDHAPHSEEEKAKGLSGSAFGVVGLETAFPALYTHLVKKKIISLEKLIDLMSKNPRERFNIPVGEDFTVWDLNHKFKVDPSAFLSKGRATPFEGMTLFGKCLLTVHNGKAVYKI
ncbi:MAG: dihydroorotase [Oscillospiraceae bacterium]|nr:dihydroorotase [Oscillospiraceae bacterium]